MFLTVEPQSSEVYVSSQGQGFIKAMKPCIRARKIGLLDEHALALCGYIGATPDDFREAVTTLEETAPTARRVLGGAPPLTSSMELSLQDARAALAAREAA